MEGPIAIIGMMGRLVIDYGDYPKAARIYCIRPNTETGGSAV